MRMMCLSLSLHCEPVQSSVVGRWQSYTYRKCYRIEWRKWMKMIKWKIALHFGILFHPSAIRCGMRCAGNERNALHMDECGYRMVNCYRFIFHKYEMPGKIHEMNRKWCWLSLWVRFDARCTRTIRPTTKDSKWRLIFLALCSALLGRNSGEIIIK